MPYIPYDQDEWHREQRRRNRTLFDKMVFDRPYYRDLKRRHPRSLVPVTLATNTYLMMLVSAIIGAGWQQIRI